MTKSKPAQAGKRRLYPHLIGLSNLTSWPEIHMARYVNGKLVEHWANVDQIGMLQQLGLAPAPGQGG
jgi:hypothetical protein